MARKRIFKDHALSGAEKKRRQDDKWASIDATIDEALKTLTDERTQSLHSTIGAVLMDILHFFRNFHHQMPRLFLTRWRIR